MTSRRLLAPALTIFGVAGAMYALYQPSYVNYDARYALVWMYDLLHGRTPDYEIAFAPTPHPLQTLVSAVALPFGNGADEVLLAILLVCFGALVWLSYRLGAELFSHWVGVVTAVVVATRPALHRDVLIAYQDVAFAMLIVWAVLLEARQERRGLPVFVLLAIAGLMRPEAWVLAGLYLLYTWRSAGPDRGQSIWRQVVSGRRPLYIALTAAAPVLWALSDLLVTGDLLHSLHGTSELAELNERRREVDQVPYWTAQYFGFVLREPLVVGIPIGLVLAWMHFRDRRSYLPLAVAGLMVLVFAAGPIFGLPLIGRYVRTPAILISVFYGLACFGWMLLPEGETRRRWRAIGLIALALSVAWLPWHFDMLRDLDARFERDGRTYDRLNDVAKSAAVKRAYENCPPITAADHRPIPHLRWWLRGEPDTIQTLEDPDVQLGRVLLVPRDTPAVDRFYRGERPVLTPPPAYERLYRNSHWEVWAAAGCGAPERQQ